jgi:hypothetical protein
MRAQVERIVFMLSRQPDNVPYDHVLYNLEMLRDIAIAEAQIARGDVIDHDELFAELLADDAKMQAGLGRDRQGKPVSPQKANSSRRTAKSNRLRGASEKARR